ncbi:ABC transporter ATP-binding protein [Aliarcobacter vitoriensis]|uniref:Sulfate ABC transporter ATP-binding protein n=1 Tax=Aliarcobacter vitoriensis TaxID=2011099 RepID=A0A366MQM3_9BACT|nr:ATP-binding cassette domain-containing protein [Aliarcobacter vitoriensis]RBQ28545.1 sulfate ABC transporter ATP-binding protein [Aliarcobacter vitoriensis]
MDIIKVSNLHTSFGKNIVHNDISFSVKEGEIFGVLGGSGSGKSVLVKQIVMLNQIQKGTIKIFDKDISKLSMQDIEKVKLDFSYLFQFGALYSFLNVIENISVMLKEYTNLPSSLIEKIAYTNLDIVGLSKHTAKLYPSELSGGMKKRVALARSLAMQPKVLFLDEPTSGLDPASTQQVNELLLYLKKNLNITIVIITHDLETIKTVLDRFIIIKKEKIFDGNINEALNSKDEFIQDFLTHKKAD